MDQDQLQKISDGQLLDVIRVRTAMYTGSRIHGIQEQHPLPGDFHDWVAYRLHFDYSTMGYKNMILERVPDESAAVDRFFNCSTSIAHGSPISSQYWKELKALKTNKS
jgi:hypothetical protein